MAFWMRPIQIDLLHIGLTYEVGLSTMDCFMAYQIMLGLITNERYSLTPYRAGDFPKGGCRMEVNSK